MIVPIKQIITENKFFWQYSFWKIKCFNDDGTIDKEATGNGMAIGALAGGLGTLGYGLNNNYKVIIKENLNKTKNFTKDKFTSLKNKFTK